MANEPEFRRMVLIGLGGTGQKILVQVKRLFLDTYGVIPPSVKLLCLDTDYPEASVRSSSGEDRYALEPHEYLHLKVDQPAEFVEAGEEVKKWYVLAGSSVGAIHSGAGAIRQNGRLGFFANLDEIRRRLNALVDGVKATDVHLKMTNAREELGAKTNFILSDRAPEVYVCGSLAGGTGSGTFLDVAILLRNQMSQVLIHGFFLLDWLFRHSTFSRRTPGNTYAALVELDYLLSRKFEGSVPYEITYGDMTVAVEKPPYDLVHLIDGRNEYDENIDDIDAICHTVAQAIWLATGSMAYKMNSVVDNLLAHINVSSPRVWKGKTARYSSLGVSSLYYPAAELHGVISAENALDLCLAAKVEAEGGADNGESSPSAEYERAAQGNSFQSLLSKLAVERSGIRQGLCPTRSIDFEVETYELGDLGGLKSMQESALQDAERSNERAFEAQGASFQSTTLGEIQTWIGAIRSDPQLDTAFLAESITEAVDHFTAWRSEASEELTAAQETTDQTLKSVTNNFAAVEDALFIPVIGGPRRRRANEWAKEVEALLHASQRQRRLKYEHSFYMEILTALEAAAPGNVPSESKVAAALQVAADQLRQEAALERRNLQLLKGKRTQVLIGNGTVVVIPDESEALVGRNAVVLPYSEFREESEISTVEDYLRIHEDDPAKLVDLFRAYCTEKLAPIKKVDLHQAMETLGKDRAGYVREQFDHLFRLSSPLWSFSKSRISELQDLQYGKIINLGVFSQEEGADLYEEHVEALRPKYKIKDRLAYSTTGDAQRIWLLNFSAALPVHFLADMQQKKAKYEDEISPSYHIDRRLEMSLPDLFPLAEGENAALRILAMAIVPGIDVIHDEYQRPLGGRGHVFTCEREEIKQMFGGGREWRLFWELYEDVKGDGNLRTTLSDLLTTQVKAMTHEQLRECIEVHVGKMREKMESRDFSRLKSARLIWREIDELERFLDKRQGYGLDIGRYIAGTR